jgi:hypothetical protein
MLEGLVFVVVRGGYPVYTQKNYGLSNLEARTCELCNVMSNQKGKDRQKKSESRASTNR